MKPDSNRKITLFVPAEVLSRAQKSTGGGITETVVQGLKLLAASRTYEELRKLKGRINLELDLKALRNDRD